METKGRVQSVAYFANWAVYDNHHPQDLPVDKLTHIIYAFAGVNPDSGQVFLTDTRVDLENRYDSDTLPNATPKPHLYGCLKQLNLLKRRNRNLKVLLSIGGQTCGRRFAAAVSTAPRRERFAETAVTLLKDCGFDGLDLFWAFPVDDKQAEHYVALLKATRGALGVYASSQQLPTSLFQLTAAGPAALPTSSLELTAAGPAALCRDAVLNIDRMDSYLDFWNLLSCDYADSWNDFAAHQANIHASSATPEATPFSTDEAVLRYVSAGVHPRKLVIGLPLYGTGFLGVSGEGKPGDMSLVCVRRGSWKGYWKWEFLPRPGSKVSVESSLIASYSFDALTRTLISYDDLTVFMWKAEWVLRHNLSGVMWWESSGDRKAGEGSAIEAVEAVMHSSIEKRENTISYPQSIYQNLRKGFPHG